MCHSLFEYILYPYHKDYLFSLPFKSLTSSALASIGCPDYEIASVLNVSARTLKRNYAEIINQYKEKGKASLRKKMWDKAVKKDNTNMQIFLSKNYLGMSDKVQQTNVPEPLPLIIEAKAEEVKDLNGKEKR